MCLQICKCQRQSLKKKPRSCWYCLRIWDEFHQKISWHNFESIKPKIDEIKRLHLDAIHFGVGQFDAHVFIVERTVFVFTFSNLQQEGWSLCCVWLCFFVKDMNNIKQRKNNTNSNLWKFQPWEEGKKKIFYPGCCHPGQNQKKSEYRRTKK